ncbi:hypothetical protein KKG31_08650 [Patescibacteria group bacterium]|nr:hypothetical protein [Patescibacteria group bacterium]MBU1759122.1 hypothetical protein [Patescibacteria group bacterium]
MISETIEREGKGLNLTPETKSGILHHDSNGEQLSIKNHPQEDVVTRIMDKIAYL